VAIAALFDHLVGSELQSGWHLETERLGSLKVDDDELEFDRLLQPAGPAISRPDFGRTSDRRICKIKNLSTSRTPMSSAVKFLFLATMAISGFLLFSCSQ